MKSFAHAQAALEIESTVHARAALQHTSSTKINVICDHRSQKGTKRFMSSKRLNFKE